MRIVQVTDVDSGTTTHIGLFPGREVAAESLKDLIERNGLYRHAHITIYDGDMPDKTQEELDRAHELGALLSENMGWA